MKDRIKLSKEQRNFMIEEIKEYFLQERQEEIGDLAADILIDFIMEHMGPIVYNKGVTDAIAFMSEKVEDMYGLEI